MRIVPRRAALVWFGLLAIGGCSRTSVGAAGLDAAAASDDGGGDAGDAAAAADGLPPGLKVVMVTNGTAALSAGDTVLVDRLHSRGFVVSFVSDVAATADAVAGQDLIVISSTAESGPLGTKIRDVAIPVVCLENGAFPTMGLTGAVLGTDYGSTFNQTTVVITGIAELTGALSDGVTITSLPAELGWGAPPAGALVGADLADNNQDAVLFGYPAGAALFGLEAPARRVGFAIRETAAANLTADGLPMFDSAVTFAPLMRTSTVQVPVVAPIASANRGYKCAKRAAPAMVRLCADARPVGSISIVVMTSPPRAAADSPTPSVPSGAITGGLGGGSLICSIAGTSPSSNMTSMMPDEGS